VYIIKNVTAFSWVIRMGDMLQPRANVDMHDKSQIRMVDDNIQLFFYFCDSSVIFFFTFLQTFDSFVSLD